MRLTVLGSGGCTVIPKPLCTCTVCKQARRKGVPYARTGPALFIHDEGLLIDTPAEIAFQLNRARIKHIDWLTFTHLDPDHTEGLRVVEQIALDFRYWEAYPDKQVRLLLPVELNETLERIQTAYGPAITFYETQGFAKRIPFLRTVEIGAMTATAIPVPGVEPISFLYVLERKGRKVVYAPCDIKPFPEDRREVQGADLLLIQPGIFESGLKHGFVYGKDHISRKTLYTFEETLALARRIQARRILFVHLEEYWNRSFDDYLALEKQFTGIQFAFDGMEVDI
jgi:phosphoribosyl 1,2-cyclic phosphate phosphodiesterase